jgi:nucleotide-binding universal stress UspA family protein
MYRHILLPTDGSRLAESAALTGIALARALGARVTTVHVLPHPPSSRLEAWAHSDRTYARKIDGALERRAHEYLDTVREAALRAGVPCDCSLVHGDSVHREILEVAEDRRCDLIVMASHGEKGDAISPLGSETVKAAMLGTVPVLVHHAPANRR